LNREAVIKQVYETGSGFLFFDGSARDVWIEAQKPPDCLLHKCSSKPETAVIKVLSESGHTLEAASRLFEVLHELDNCKLSQIYAQLAPQYGLGEAINDRLKRASI
jgi:L-threonylcarbamoyladenylate synthase